MWPVLAMAAGSMLLNQQQRHDADRNNAAAAKAAAAQTQFSPWTKMGPGQAEYQKTQSDLSAGVQGGMAGASMAQNYNQAQTQNDLAKSQMDMNNAQGAYYTQNQNPWTQKAKLMGNQHQGGYGYSGMMG
jgi:hypothetical protein